MIALTFVVALVKGPSISYYPLQIVKTTTFVQYPTEPPPPSPHTSLYLHLSSVSLYHSSLCKDNKIFQMKWKLKYRIIFPVVFQLWQHNKFANKPLLPAHRKLFSILAIYTEQDASIKSESVQNMFENKPSEMVYNSLPCLLENRGVYG